MIFLLAFFVNCKLILDVLLVPRKQSLSFKDLEPCEVFDVALALKFLTKNLEKFHSCSSSTIFVQVKNILEIDLKRIEL